MSFLCNMFSVSSDEGSTPDDAALGMHFLSDVSEEDSMEKKDEDRDKSPENDENYNLIELENVKYNAECSEQNTHDDTAMRCFSFQYIKGKADKMLPLQPGKPRATPQQFRLRKRVLLNPKKGIEMSAEVAPGPERVYYIQKPIEEQQSMYVTIRKTSAGEGVVAWGLTSTSPHILDVYLSPPYCHYDCTYRLVVTQYRECVLHTAALTESQGFLMNVPKEGHINWQGRSYKMNQWSDSCVGRPVWLFFLVIGQPKVQVSSVVASGASITKSKIIAQLGPKPNRRKVKVLRRLSMTEPSKKLQKIRKRSLTCDDRSPVKFQNNSTISERSSCLCKVCSVEESTSLSLPCGHLVLCSTCALLPPKCCPFCYMKLTDTLCLYPTENTG